MKQNEGGKKHEAWGNKSRTKPSFQIVDKHIPDQYIKNMHIYMMVNLAPTQSLILCID